VTFARFEVLYILIGVLLLLAIIQWRKKKHYLAHSLVSQPVMPSLKPSYLRFLPRIFLVIGLLGIGIALMEPRITFKEGVTELEGLDIVLVVDLSSSMQEVMGGWEEHRELYAARAKGDLTELPIPETRMQAVQNALLDFVSKRDEDRLALVTFSENSYVVSPLTTDRLYLEKYIRMIDPAILIGEGDADAQQPNDQKDSGKKPQIRRLQGWHDGMAHQAVCQVMLFLPPLDDSQQKQDADQNVKDFKSSKAHG